MKVKKTHRERVRVRARDCVNVGMRESRDTHTRAHTEKESERKANHMASLLRQGSPIKHEKLLFMT